MSKHTYGLVGVDEWRGDRVRSRLCARQLKAEGLKDDLVAERQTHFSSSILVVDIRVAFMHARNDEEKGVKVLSGVKSSRFWRLQAAVNGKRKGSKHWQEFSCDKLVTNMLSNRTTSIRVITESFVIIWTWNSTATIFSTSNWKCWQMNSRLISWFGRL